MIIIITYGLFNDAANCSDYMMSNNRMINEQWIEKVVEGCGFQPS